jgi:hypothetical protein
MSYTAFEGEFATRLPTFSSPDLLHKGKVPKGSDGKNGDASWPDSVHQEFGPADNRRSLQEVKGPLTSQGNSAYVTPDMAIRDTMLVQSAATDTLAVPIRSVGNATLSAEGKLKGPDAEQFEVLSSTELKVLPGEKKFILIRYDPETADAHEAVFEITHDASNEKNPAEVVLQSKSSETFPFAGGAGTEEFPYQLASADHLRTVGDYPVAYFVLTQDIDMSEVAMGNNNRGFAPIGSDEPFTGTLDGDGHVIEGLTINRGNETGLFSVLGEDGLVKDVKLVDVEVSGASKTGGLVGKNEGRIQNVHVEGDVDGSSRAGGLVGANWTGGIYMSSAEVDVSSDVTAGGLVGMNKRTIENSHARGSVEADSVAGGLTAVNTYIGAIRDSYATGDVTGEVAGGLVGLNNWYEAEIRSSFATGTVSGDGNLGGLVGDNQEEGPIVASYWDVEATGQENGVGTGDVGEARGLTTSEMTGVEAPSNMSELDFQDTWLAQGDYPVLRWEAPDLATEKQVTVSSSGRTDVESIEVALNFFQVSGSGALSVQRYEGRPDSASAIEEKNVSNYHYVILAEEALTFDSTEVRFDAQGLDGVGDPEAVTVYRRPKEGKGAFEPVPTGFDTSENELFVVVEEFSEFALASDSEPLPVELARLQAQVRQEAVRLTWTTASETGNAGFRVQRRAGDADKGSWTTVGSVKGEGTTTEPTSYRYVDEELPYEADRLTYRLKQVDTDGSASYSKEVTVKREVKEAELLGTHPNPAQTHATLRYAVPERQDVKIHLYDVLGRRVRTVVDGEREGRQEMQVDLSELPSGTYFLRLRAGGQTKTRQVTVVR